MIKRYLSFVQPRPVLHILNDVMLQRVLFIYRNIITYCFANRKNEYGLLIFESTVSKVMKKANIDENRYKMKK